MPRACPIELQDTCFNISSMEKMREHPAQLRADGQTPEMPDRCSRNLQALKKPFGLGGVPGSRTGWMHKSKSTHFRLERDGEKEGLNQTQTPFSGPETGQCLSGCGLDGTAQTKLRSILRHKS